MRRGGEEIRGVLGFWWEKGLGRRETRGKRKGMSISTTHKTGIGPSGRAAEGDTGGFGWWPRKDECLKTSASCTGKRLPGISIVDFLFIFLIISLFMHLSGRFWLSFVTWVYYCSVFFVTFSWHSLKDKSGYGSSYATDHEALWFQHEMGSHILSLLFVCHFKHTLFGVVHLCICYLNPCLCFWVTSLGFALNVSFVLWYAWGKRLRVSIYC